MMNFNRAEFDAFRSDFEKSVKELQSKYGVSIHLGGIRYSEVSFTAKLEVAKIDPASGVKADDGMTDEYITLYHPLLRKVLGEKSFIGSRWMDPTGRILIGTGYKPRATKMPFALELNGKGVKCPEAYLTRLLQLKEAPPLRKKVS